MATLVLHPADLETAGLWSPVRRALTTGLVLTTTLVALEALAVATIMPVITGELGDLWLYGWAFSAFFLGNLLGIAIVGSLIDRGGLVRPFVAGLALFSAGLLVAGLAPSMPVFVAGRLLQGIGAGTIPPIAYVAIGRALPGSLRARMLAILSTAWVLPGLLGPAISGAVAEQTSWRWIFLGLLPLIAVAGLLTLPAMRAVPPAADPGGPDAPAGPDRRLLRAVILTTGAAILLAGLTSGSAWPGLPLVLVGLVVGVPAFRALTPSGTLRAAAGLPAAVLLRGMLTFAFFAADAFVALALHDWRHQSVAVAGITLTAATLAWTAGAWIQARQHGIWGSRRLGALGFATLAIGIAGFAAVLLPEVPIAAGVVAWAVAGLGMGFAYSTFTLVVLAEAPAGSEGTASSALQLSDVLGTALGTGAGGAIIAAADASGAGLGAGLAGAFAVGLALAGLGFGLTRRLPGRPPDRSGASRAAGVVG